MSAGATDKFKKLSRRWVGQIGAGAVADGTVTTVPLSSVTNLPTDTGVVVVIDRVDANGTSTPQYEETIIGVVSGTNLINCVRGAEGTAQAHNAGAVVEVLVTAKGWNDLVDGLLVQHSQTGYHTDLTACQVNIISYNGWTTDAPSASQVTMNMAATNKHQITLSDSTTSIYVSNVQVGQAFMIRPIQNGTGTRLVSWFPGSTVKWAGGSSPTLTTTASKADSFGFVSLAASTYDGFIVGQNI